MNQELNDATGTPVVFRLEEARPIGAYTVSLAGGPTAGRVDFVDVPDDGVRIIFHTEVDAEFSGRGLAGLLVREALADTVRADLMVVPVCPLFARHLDQHGDEFIASGGRFRRPTQADVDLVRRMIRIDA